MSGEEEEDIDEKINWRQPADIPISSEATAGRRRIDGRHDDGQCKLGPRNTAPWTLRSTTSNESSPSKKQSHFGHNKSIIHIDFDCFYCQVEVIRNPALRDRPFGVYQKHIVVSSNYVARRLGVKKMSTKTEALKVCPEMIMVNGEDLTMYREFSMKMFKLLKNVSPIVERVGLDENFIDVTKLIDDRSPSVNEKIVGHCYGYDGRIDMSLDELLTMEADNGCSCGCFSRMAMASSLAAEMRKSLYDNLGLTSSAGISHSKVLAKLVGKIHKPNQQTTILPTFAGEFLSSKNVREIPGIGSRCSKVLHSIGVETVSDLARLTKDDLKSKFGLRQGDFLADISLGIDKTEVNASEGFPKSISEEESYRKLTDFAEVQKEMTLLIEKLVTRLIKDGRSPRTIKLTLRKRFSQNFAKICRQEHFDPKLLKAEKDTIRVDTILEILTRLFDKMIDRAQGFDLAVINICFTNFEEVAANSSSISNFFGKKNTSQLKSGKVHDCMEQSTVDKSSINKNLDYNFSEAEIPKKPEQTERCFDVCGKPSIKATTTFISSLSKDSLVSHKQWNHNDLSSRGDARIVLEPMPGVSGILSDGEEAAQPECMKPFTCLDQTEIGDNKDLESELSGFLQGVKDDEFIQGACEFKCLDGIDPDVFRQLPKEIRDELLENWRKKEHDVVDVRSCAGPPQKKQKKSGSLGTNSIRNYFTK